MDAVETQIVAVLKELRKSGLSLNYTLLAAGKGCRLSPPVSIAPFWVD